MRPWLQISKDSDSKHPEGRRKQKSENQETSPTQGQPHSHHLDARIRNFSTELPSLDAQSRVPCYGIGILHILFYSLFSSLLYSRESFKPLVNTDHFNPCVQVTEHTVTWSFKQIHIVRFPKSLELFRSKSDEHGLWIKLSVDWMKQSVCTSQRSLAGNKLSINVSGFIKHSVSCKNWIHLHSQAG